MTSPANKPTNFLPRLPVKPATAVAPRTIDRTPPLPSLTITPQNEGSPPARTPFFKVQPSVAASRYVPPQTTSPPQQPPPRIPRPRNLAPLIIPAPATSSTLEPPAPFSGPPDQPEPRLIIDYLKRSVTWTQ